MEDFYDMHVGLYNPGDFGGSNAAPGPACDHKFRILRWLFCGLEDAPPAPHDKQIQQKELWYQSDSIDVRPAREHALLLEQRRPRKLAPVSPSKLAVKPEVMHGEASPTSVVAEYSYKAELPSPRELPPSYDVTARSPKGLGIAYMSEHYNHLSYW